VPNSYVNDNGKPNLNNSNADNDNDNDARVSVRIEVTLTNALTPAANLTTGFGKFCLNFQSVGIVDEVEFKKRPQFQGCQFGARIGSNEVCCLMGFWGVFGEDELLQSFTTAGDRRLTKRVAIFFIDGRDKCC